MSEHDGLSDIFAQKNLNRGVVKCVFLCACS